MSNPLAGTKATVWPKGDMARASFKKNIRWYILTIVKGQFRRWPMKIKLAPVLTSNLTSKDCENTEGGGM
jgi:hypothetical protein